MSASDALKAHIDAGAVLHLSDKPALNMRALLGVALMAGNLLAPLAAQANPALDLAPSTPAAVDVLKLSPDAPATPANLARLYKTLEETVDRQFPEHKGRVALFDRTANPATEHQRIGAKIGDGWAEANPALAIVKGAQDGAKAFIGSGDSARPYCVVIGFPVQAGDTLELHAASLIHEFTHCFDPYAQYKIRQTVLDSTYEVEAIETRANNMEIAAQLGRYAWLANAGLMTHDRMVSVVGSNENRLGQEARYLMGDQHFAYQNAYQHKVVDQRAGQLDFSTLRQSIEEGVAARNAMPSSYNDVLVKEVQINLQHNLMLVARSMAPKDNEQAAEKLLLTWLDTQRDTPMFARMGDALRSTQSDLSAKDVAALRFGDTLYNSAKMSEPLDTTYARLLNKGASNDPFAQQLLDVFPQNLFVLLSKQNTAAGEDNEVNQELALLHLEKIQQDSAYRAKVADGKVSLIAATFAQNTLPAPLRAPDMAGAPVLLPAQTADTHIEAASPLKNTLDTLARDAGRPERIKIQAARMVLNDPQSTSSARLNSQMFLQGLLVKNGRADLVEEVGPPLPSHKSNKGHNFTFVRG